MSYKPKPMDTSDTILPKEVLELKESMAKNTHEQWAKQRMSEGWIYGKNRNDQQKTHPCLIPYEALPEEEKEYDRITALETIKLIIKLGFTIEKSTKGERDLDTKK